VTTTTASPQGPKPIAVFAVQALLLSLLIGFWPTPRALYPAFVRSHVGAVLGVARDRIVTLRPSAGAEQEDGDTVMEGFRPGDRVPRWRAGLSTLHLGWWPTAVVAALVLATPMTTRRRVLALLGGCAFIEGYVLLRLSAEAGFADYEARYGPGGPLAGPLHALLRTSVEVLEANGVLVAFVLLAWVVVARPSGAFDTSRLSRLLGRGARPPRG